MKKRNVFLLGLLVVLLAMGLVFVGCGDGDSGNNGGKNKGGQNSGGNDSGGQDNGGQNSGDNDSGDQNSGGGTAPGAPTGVTATATSASSISVSWNAVSGATSYDVYYEIGNSKTKNLAGNSTGNSYTHTGLTASTTYYYYIKAKNSAGVSEFSDFGVGMTPGSSLDKPNFVDGDITLSRIYIYWSFVNVPQNVVIEAWRPSNRSWATITTLPGSDTSYNWSGYGTYKITGNNGPQGIPDENGIIIVRVRAKDGTTLGSPKAVYYDTLTGGNAFTTGIPSIYEN